MLVVDR